LAADRCGNVAGKLEDSARQNDEPGVINHYLHLLIEAKALKMHIGKILKKPVDITDFENYEVQVKKKYKGKVQTHRTYSIQT